MFEFDRPTGLFSHQRRKEKEGLVAGITTAKLPAHIFADDTHIVNGNLQHLAHVHTRLIGGVRIGDNSQFIIIPLGHTTPRVKSTLGGVVVHCVHLQHNISVLKAFLNVPFLEEHIRSAYRVMRQNVFRSSFRVHQWSIWLHGRDGVHHKR
ncbi:hypothetical protein SDC9_188506 [bioreactor metagenome]|uniref:Uncharacterized protein n=1 Tax=bioreactor metagenome TaxID=1076179 RepID=A0A645HQX7_9ZZZZ